MEREGVAARITALCGTIRPLRQGEIVYSRTEAVRREAAALLLAGGEQAPRLTVDPREPRHGEVITEVEVEA